MSAEMDLQQHRPERLLVVVAHPGDAEVSMGGAIARWAAEGTVAALVCTTSGEAYGDDSAADPLTLAALREEQQRAAAAILGCGHVTFLHRPDGALANDLPLREQLVRIIRDFRPDAVATFDPRTFIDEHGLNHVDHRVIGEATLDALDAATNAMAFPALVRSEELEPHRVQRVLLLRAQAPTRTLDITDSHDAKRRALAAHTGERCAGGVSAARLQTESFATIDLG